MRFILAAILTLLPLGAVQAVTVKLEGYATTLTRAQGIYAGQVLDVVGDVPVNFAFEINFPAGSVPHSGDGMEGVLISSNVGGLSLGSAGTGYFTSLTDDRLVQFGFVAGTGSDYANNAIIYINIDTGLVDQRYSSLGASFNGGSITAYGSTTWRNITLTKTSIPSSFFGVVPSQPVPEPATWAMLVSAFAVVGGIMRRTAAARPLLA